MIIPVLSKNLQNNFARVLLQGLQCINFIESCVSVLGCLTNWPQLIVVPSQLLGHEKCSVPKSNKPTIHIPQLFSTALVNHPCYPIRRPWVAYVMLPTHCLCYVQGLVSHSSTFEVCLLPTAAATV